MTYNLSNFTAANNFLDMGVASNDLTGGWLAVVVVILLFGISLLASLRGADFKNALLGTSFVFFVLTVSLWATELVPERAAVIAFVVLLFAVMIAVVSD